MAAIDTIMKHFYPGDHIIVGDDVYGGTFRLFDRVLEPYGLSFTYVDSSNLDNVRNALRSETRMIWVETPTNPLLKLTDIGGIVALAPEGVMVAVDSTFASPYLQRPLDLGADIVVHSITKYIGGHSDVVGGAVMLNDLAVYENLKFLQNTVGAVPGPMDCFLTLRGIKTLHLRMERHCQNALQVARFLEDQAVFKQVIYPGLESHPQHELARHQMGDFGGMISVIMIDGAEAAKRFVSSTKLFSLAESLGGVESLIEHPYSMTHASTAESDIAVDPGLVRFSIGVEHIDDLVDDLRQALNELKKET
jgi:cystathionine beta-lyase/cystathionine gamma-synthase